MRECNECRGTGKLERPIPHYFVEGGDIVAKYRQTDGTYREQTYEEYLEERGYAR